MTGACAPVSGSTFPIGTTPVDCTATDESGNSTDPTSLFDVTVADTTGPEVVVTGALAITLEVGTAFVDPGATASDVVDGTLTTTVTGTGQTSVPGVYTLTYTATDASGNIGTAIRTVTVVDTTPPTSLTATVTPTTLWPPNGAIIPVTVSGTALDGGSGVATLRWTVVDEYGQYQPSGEVSVPGDGPFSFQVPLLADRLGSDKDGRHYTITIAAVDRSGNSLLLATPLVVNVHDQGGD